MSEDKIRGTQENGIGTKPPTAGITDKIPVA